MARRPARSERGALRLDPRLLIGLVLVAGSTTGVWALVNGLDDAIEVYSVRDTVTAGSRIDAGDLVVESVRLGSTGDTGRRAHHKPIEPAPSPGHPSGAAGMRVDKPRSRLSN